MSKVFSNTTTKDGLIQNIERNCGFNDGDISGNAVRLAQFTGDINSSMDWVYTKIFEVGGTWQFDDANHVDYPIITTTIMPGQRDYSFSTDGTGNRILEIFRVSVADVNGNFYDIQPVDVSGSNAPSSFTDGLNVTGLPNTYDKLGNGIFLDPIPNYLRAAGLRVYINRESSYFVTTDTTKKAGFAGLFHEYLCVRPSYYYCLRNKMFDLADRYKLMMIEMETAIENYYKSREKDVAKTLIGATNNSR